MKSLLFFYQNGLKIVVVTSLNRDNQNVLRYNTFIEV